MHIWYDWLVKMYLYEVIKAFCIIIYSFNLAFFWKQETSQHKKKHLENIW